jgi:hypothetical protein
MKKIDLKKELKYLYQPADNEASIVEVPPMNFLMIDGQGSPGKSVDFKQAIDALFTISYVIKFAIEKSKLQIDYTVMPLEGLWWCREEVHYRQVDKDKWLWTLMVLQPDYVHRNLVEAAIRETKKQKDLPVFPKMRFDSYFEGSAAQIMHRGLFFEEGPTVKKLHQFIKDNRFGFSGKHHEVYLSDIRDKESERWRTIIRQPIRKGRSNEI